MSENNNRNSRNTGKGNRSKFNKKGKKNSREYNNSESRDKRSEYGDVNDASYYIHDPNLLPGLTNYSFNQFLGTPVEFGKEVFRDNSISSKIGNIMTICLNPSAGFTGKYGPELRAAGVNMAGFKMYEMFSANNGKTSQYAPQDVTTLILALGSLISYVGYLKRFFGLAWMYNPRNRSFPLTLLKNLTPEHDFDAEDFIANLAEYRTRFNTKLNVINQIPFPANIDYFKKCGEIYTHVYVDKAGTDMYQTYAFVPFSVWKFDEAYNEQGSGLVTTKWDNTTPVSMSNLLDVLDILSNALLSSTTLNYVYSDILRCAQKQNLPLYAFTTIPEFFVEPLVYNEEISLMINNLTIMSQPLAGTSDANWTKLNDVAPSVDTNAIMYRPKFMTMKSNDNAFPSYGVTNFAMMPNDAQKIEATRLISMVGAAVDETIGNVSYRVATLVALPDFYVVKVNLTSGIDNDYIDLASSVRGLTNPGNLNVLCVMSQFDWHPILYLEDPTHTTCRIFGDLQYFTNVDYKYLKSLNDVAMLSLLEIK